MVRRIVIAPHGDDEVMGCGGLLAKYRDVVVVICAEMDEDRKREAVAAQDALGYGRMIELGMVDGSLGDLPMALVDTLDAVFERVKPDEVYLPYPGSHQDHVAVFEAGMRASRMSLNPAHWAPSTVLVYETPTYDLDLVERGLRFNVFETLTDREIQAKVLAMQAYDSQVRKPHAGSPVELLARARSLGLARGLEFAEQYAAVRLVRP